MATAKLRGEVKQMWLAALRSGEYEQGAAWLLRYDDNGTKRYCCLGVLCELAAADGVDVAVERMGDLVSFGDNESLPPQAVSAWALVDGEYASIGHLELGPAGSSDRPTFAELNDFHGKTFVQIADIIEREL